MSRSLDARVPVLLGAQLAFNLGFYAVVPFLALVLTREHDLGGAAVGLVLGIRTFAQQGMFLLGGLLADRWGPRTLIVVGCAVRCLGFLALGLAGGLPALLLGAVLTGLGGALFSPALQVLVAAAEERRPAASHSRRATLFALLTVVGEVGAATGPLLGALLLGWGFLTVSLGGAALFAVVGVVLGLLLPRSPRPAPAAAASTRSEPSSTPEPVTRAAGDRGPDPVGGRRRRRPVCLTDRRFVAFVAVCSVNLLAYNQLYLALPVELRRVGAGETALALLFAVVSVLTITTQLPLARWARGVGPGRSLVLGFVLTAAGFAVLAVTAPLPAPTTWPLAPAAVMVVLVTAGHLLLTPVSLDLVSRFAGPHPRGQWFGLLATAGGVAVLLGSIVLGRLLDGAAAPGPAATWPWLLLTLVAVASALAVRRCLPTEPAEPVAHPDHQPAAGRPRPPTTTRRRP